MIIYNLSVSQLVGRDTGPVPNGSLHPRGLPLSPHFRDVMPLWLSGRSLVRAQQKFGSRAHNGHKGGAREHPSEC